MDAGTDKPAASGETGIDPRYLHDWSGLERGTPRVLHRPRSTEEVAAIVAACDRDGSKITVQGGLTGLAGGAVPADGDVVINLERMNAIEHVDSLEGIMQVQAGATLQQVQLAAEAAGWYFPVDLGARGSCQVGGNASTNAGGIRVIRYGTMRDAVLGLEVVLADGSVVTSLTRLVKNSAGLDPRFLFIGSEGTLGIITRLTLRLQPKPGDTVTAFAALPSLDGVTSLLRDLRRALGPSLSAFEFMSTRFVDLSLRLTGVARPLETAAPWYVLLDATGAPGADVTPALHQALEHAMADGLVADCAVAANGAQGQRFWRVREGIPEILTELKPLINFDVGLPWVETRGFIERAEATLTARFPEATHLFFGHLGDNNIHVVSGPHRPVDFHAVDEIVYGELHGRRATISAEHGIGFIKKPFLHVTRSPEEIALLRRLKTALDLNATLNPGRVFD
ncbi:FAD-binding oxidoreductase [Piscinibacter koreensis]|uniref:FAD-binding oxidoreductase n=1 Tax=Piscinibacter koreensis TaxID=2742824 RepID=A0A7Y6NQA8_9BURK|nr:FAD-binding oxidoreductase [Schlegelella koreensis]NUZ07289.1 FAD-binding oxidoreductase [Schlegelella koreensis]